MADGSFGSNENRRITTNPASRVEYRERRRRIGMALSDLRYRTSALSPKRWVDILFGLLFFICGITIACNWRAFSDALFYNVLFPVIYVGGKILLVVIVIAIIIVSVSLRVRRRRYWL